MRPKSGTSEACEIAVEGMQAAEDSQGAMTFKSLRWRIKTVALTLPVVGKSLIILEPQLALSREGD